MTSPIGKIVHGDTIGRVKSAEYRAWLGMRRRCYSSNEPQFADWGGRGIVVCAQWLHDFSAFLRDVGRRPSPRHSLDRIDVNGNYEPQNVRWATMMQQQRNKRNVRLLTVRGETRPRTEWAEIVGINPNTLIGRLRDGFSPEDALFMPVRPTRKA